MKRATITFSIVEMLYSVLMGKINFGCKVHSENCRLLSATLLLKFILSILWKSLFLISQLGCTQFLLHLFAYWDLCCSDSRKRMAHPCCMTRILKKMPLLLKYLASLCLWWSCWCFHWSQESAICLQVERVGTLVREDVLSYSKHRLRSYTFY